MTAACEPLILASSSPRRRELLEAAGIACQVCPPSLDEPQDCPPSLSSPAWAESLAYLKARSVAERFPARLVLGADTIVVCADRILGKPRDLADARAMLELQAGRESQVITGIALVRADFAPLRRLAHAVTRVWMRDCPAEREDYLAGGDWRGKAGAYGIQNVGDRLVERIEGSFSNVVGLPVELVRALLAAIR